MVGDGCRRGRALKIVLALALAFVGVSWSPRRDRAGEMIRRRPDDCDPFARVQTCQPRFMRPQLVSLPVGTVHA